MTTTDEMPWFISQSGRAWRYGDERLKPVRASASVAAASIVEELLRGSYLTDEGGICISHWSLHRVALRLEQIAAHGLDPEDGLGPHEAAR